MSPFENKLKTVLYRRECPPGLELGEYELGILDMARRNEIVSHLAMCPHCQADLGQMRQFMAMPAVDLEAAIARPQQRTPLLERIKVVVVNLVTLPESLTGTMPQPVFRGSEENDTRVIEADEYVISLSTVTDQATWPKRNMIGNIIPLGEDEDFADWSANLWRSGKLLASAKVAADSHFVFADVQFEASAHELILSGPSVEIHLQNLQLA